MDDIIPLQEEFLGSLTYCTFLSLHIGLHKLKPNKK